MKFPACSQLAGNFGVRDGFARDCPLLRKVNKLSVPLKMTLVDGASDGAAPLGVTTRKCSLMRIALLACASVNTE